MEALGVRLALDPAGTATALAFVLGGVALGTASGLVPGLHVNNLALLLASVAPAVPGPPRLVGAAMLAAGVVHSFLDAVPALALGVPDPAMAATALPGHRLVIAGRGREAIRLSALGSGLAVALAVPLAVPVTHLMTTAYPTLRAHMPVVLGAVTGFLVVSERTPRAAVGGAAAFLASAGLGYATLDVNPAAPLDAGGMLTPLFAGLFGAPILLDALSGSGVPEQDDATVAIPRRAVGVTALAGAVAGAVVGYLPGVSSAIAAVLALTAVPGSTGARGFVVTTSGVNTANTIFALFALAALGAPRTGVMVALQETGAPVNLPLLLAAAGLAGVAGFALVLTVGDRYLVAVGSLDYARLSTCILALLVGLSWLFAGPVGVAVFGAATLVGLVPVRFGARRVHLMGVLIGPLMVGG
ncbi:tripartite tricarboxylate transporter permease [Halorussus salilacus]|uniref:tripartite tricarboxylate transporter permease n=1 Tax=Halorussus salilacus TaxID=2953750 RepID=UPI00209C8741|nr:tripartite tricarboxylate transporter permease [Halorussus salilacus]USZ68635.1 tripartite tricarboxylate transporter permease [Halorussus salilacus]